MYELSKSRCIKLNTRYRSDLELELPFSNKEIFSNIRNYLAGRLIGATRDRALLDEVLKLLFCKYYLDLSSPVVSYSNDAEKLISQYRETFSIIKEKFSELFDASDKIQLDPTSVVEVHNRIKDIDFLNSSRDIFGDLYEIFINTGIREDEGQFFTPQGGIKFLVDVVDPKPNETILDPAAGAGGFLSYVILKFKNYNIPFSEAVKNIYGIEKDSYLADIMRKRIALISFSHTNVLCGDSLSWTDINNNVIELKNKFDVILTNPPFGKNIISVSKDIQKNYDLGYEWKYDDSINRFYKTNRLTKKVPPQVLFAEKCIKLLKPGGRLGMVVPESLITSKIYRHVVQYFRDNGHFNIIVGMPEDFFKTSGKNGTHTKVCLITFIKRKVKEDNKIFFAEAKHCGNDSRGRNIDRDDLPIIYNNYVKIISQRRIAFDQLGYLLDESNLYNNILSPRYYNPSTTSDITKLKSSHDIRKIEDLVRERIIEIKTGNEVGKNSYGTGSIPFVRTSDISNWEIKIDPKHGVSEDIYNSFKLKQDIQKEDILMVKDGTYLIGTCAIVTKYDQKIIYQSHLYKIRVLQKEIISPYLLLAVLSSEPVQNQIKSKRFTQDIIDSLGARINELLLPIPKDKKHKRKIENAVKKAIEDRIEARELARQACRDVIKTS